MNLKNDGNSFVVAEPVEGTPWRVVLTVDSATLFKPISGTNRVLPWIFISCFAFAAAALIVLLVRGRERRLQLQNVALIDLLTGIYNPRGVKLHIKRLISSARRHNDDLSIFKIDIDNFKAFNEKHGSSVGDEILTEVVKEIQSRLRTEDILGRCGGEEFIVVLPDTDVSGATIVAERIRRGVEEDVRSKNESLAGVTISIGITDIQEDDSVESISERAEKALLKSKTAGKNIVSTD